MGKDYLYYRELYHHGVKGQKWGVRNEKEDPNVQRSKASALGKKMSRAAGGAVGAIVGSTAAFAASKAVKQLLSSTLSDTVISSKAGQFFSKYADHIINLASTAGGVSLGVAGYKYWDKKYDKVREKRNKK